MEPLRMSRRAAWAALTLLAVTGCLQPWQTPHGMWGGRPRRATVPNHAELCHLEVRFIERSINDPYINKDAWDHVDPWIVRDSTGEVDIDRKDRLERNGFRIGQIVGAVPARLQLLMTSKRSCVDPRWLMRPWGKTTRLPVGPIRDRCRVALTVEGKAERFEFLDGQCVFRVTPTTTKDGRTRLRFVPAIEHGEYRQVFRPAKDLSDWIMQPEKASRDFSELAFEVSLGNNELLLIGTRLENRESLAYEMFVDAKAEPPVQRLLVFRVNRCGQVGIDAEIPQPDLADRGPGRTLVRAVHPD